LEAKNIFMRILLYFTLVLLLVNPIAKGQNKVIVSKASEFLSLLDDSQRDSAQYPFENEERFNWHFVPRQRNGIAFKNLTDKQRKAGLEIFKASLSEQGFQKASNIMALENVLREVESRGNDDTYRDPLNYSITIFGTPRPDSLWGWRLEGHHISINFSSESGEIVSATPTFWGSNPGIVRTGVSRGKQVLKAESDLGFTLVNSLEKDQMKTAVVSQKAPSEIITGNQRSAALQEPAGLSYTSLNEAQQKIFLQLLNVYVKNYQLGFANKLMAKIQKAGIENLSFAWAGSLQPGAGHYYRIQGPMLLIEFDNTQNNANHIHTVVRDLTNDFAEDILREHYQKEH
jgi:hypothetical protein